jgi:hypothetical protein
VRSLRNTPASAGEQQSSGYRGPTRAAFEGRLTTESHEPEPQRFVSSRTPHELALPSDIPVQDLPDDYQEQVQAFGAVAADAGIDARVSQRLLNAAATACSTSAMTSRSPASARTRTPPASCRGTHRR